jgi:gluconolactonase
MKPFDNLEPDDLVLESAKIKRRSFIAGAVTAAALPIAALAQQRYGQNAAPTRYPDPDILVLDKRFAKYKVGTGAMERLYTGCRWAEGPAWNGGGNYLVWSDIPNNRHLRWLAEDGHVSALHSPSNYANGNTFDYEGRLLSCEHGTRRVVRYEHDGTVTLLAEKWQGKQFNAPNDIVVHPDGGIWFSDPGYGALGNYEGNKGELLLKEAVYRVDPKTAKIDIVNKEMYKPNGLCFSPDYKKLYICDTGATHYPDAPKNIMVFDVADGKRLQNGREYCSMKLTMKNGEFAGLADGIRADVDGNIWVGAGWVGEGYDGVHIFAPDGQRIGQILLPEICANLCFGGPKRNRLFMAASQSLYSAYVETQGAHIC